MNCSININGSSSSSQNNNNGLDQYNFNGALSIHNVNTPESVLERLTPHISTNALHNAKGRANRRACLEGTRGGLIEKLGKWIEDPEEHGGVYWVKAGAGVGKTAMAQTLCEKYSQTEDSESLLAAAYFFSRNDASRNSMTRLVPTIAYQLARSPALQPHLADTINAAILSDPGIVGADWEDQFKRLVREPCNRVDPGLWKTLPRVVIIDGLDECMDNHESQAPSQGRDAWRRDGQAALLSIIRDAMTSSSHPLPLRFLIFSRPERVISNFFRTNTSSIPNLGQLDMRNLRVEADQDIELYLRHEFPRFPTLHPDAGLDESWPGEEVIEILTRKSDGHFIYVVTAVKYVMENGPSLSLPQDRLQIVLYPKTTAYPDLSTMDQLYYSILLPFSDIWKGVLLRIFQFITPPLEISRYGKYHPLRYLFRRRLADRIHYYPHRYNIESGEPCAPSQWNSKLAIAAYLKLDPRQLSVVLSQLRSVLYVPDNDQDSVTFLHASFSDFLTDKRRSHDFYVPPLGPFKHILWMMWYYSSVTTSIAKNWALHARKKCILAVGIGTETNTDGRTPSEEH